VALEQAHQASASGRITLPAWFGELSPLGLMALYAFAVHFAAAGI